jgi:outer membrane protein assembly factor BamE (lipoprotein component of BamABCDE complex)
VRYAAGLVCLLMASGCYSFSQGDWFDARAVPSLKSGMSKVQVLETIGRPQLAYVREDGKEAWAYQYAKDFGMGLSLIVFSILRADPESHALTLAFDGDVLKGIDYQAYLGLPEKGPLQVHRGQPIALPEGKAKKRGAD